jgi:hypothetical protein
VTEVGDGGSAEGALGALDEEVVLAQLGENGAEVPEVIRPSLAIDQNIVKKDKDEPAQEGVEYIIH